MAITSEAVRAVRTRPAWKKGTSPLAARLVRLGPPLGVWAASRMGLLLAGWTIRLAIPDSGEPGSWHGAPGNALLDGWARWDSGYYLGIATAGYHHLPGDSSLAFFPLYPLLLALLTKGTGDPLVSGVVLSNLALLGALCVLHRLALDELGDEDAAARALVLLVCAPTAFFFAAVYTESLFLFLALATWRSARRRRWALADAFGALAAATRLVGLALLPAVLLEWARGHGFTLRAGLRREAWRGLCRGLRADLRSLAPLLLVPLGLLAFMAFQWVRFGDPLLFVRVQANWGRSAEGPLLVLGQAVHDLWKADLLSGRDLLWHLPFDVAAFAAVLALVPAVWRRLGEGAAFYTLATVLLPAATGFDSMSRYALAAFPALLAVAGWRPRSPLATGLAVGLAVLQGVFLSVFVSWRFVA